ncbi:TPR-like protein [Parathielavia hyrcaniae]|uniref:TPR-like protein n=1 Tax=Parathielavia hyrcaniae TaxID=113614 RepID=A0AAN6PVK4_9PEZI|nr:TPR-like protein [Parathielavia hyrcaniae]
MPDDSTPPLTEWLSTGRYLDVLLGDAAATLIAGFVRPLPGEGDGDGEGEGDGDGDGDGDGSVSARDRLTVGLAALNAFLQGNVTGPVLDEKKVRMLQGRFQGLSLRKACLRSLEVDGVSVYQLVPLVEVFCLARWILLGGGGSEGQLDSEPEVVGGLNGGAGRESLSGPWLALRVRVWHYKLLTQPSLGPGSVFNKAAQWCDVPSLRDEIERGLEEVGGEVLGDGAGAGSGWGRPEQVRFLVEKANVCVMLGQDVKAREALRRATELSGFVYALSGALGKRTRFQEKSTSQLVVLAKSGEMAGAGSGDLAKPQALALNDDTLLESLEFTKEKTGDEKSGLPAALRDLAPDEQPQLSPLDQIILLAEATLKDAFSPADSLTAEEVLPFAVRVISDKSTNWQIYTHALLVRSRIEVHRSRTIERGVLQMQAVVDQVVVDTTQTPETNETTGDRSESAVPEIHVTADGDETHKPTNKPASIFPAPKPTESAPAQVRLEHIHALSSPPRWHLESELAYSWAGVGSLVSALEIFKRLRLWAEVALCFASSAAKDDEGGRGSSGEAKAKAVLRWRLFHKTGRPVNLQGAAADESDEEVDLDDLKEADYHGPERQPPPPNAPRLWCILGDIENDPAHYERAWEISMHRFARAQRSLGEYYLQQKNLQRARDAYQKAVAVNRLSAELWNRLGDISLRLGDFADAAEAFGRAIAASDNISGGEDARTWSNLGSALYSRYVERVKEVKQQKELNANTTTTIKPTAAGDDDDDDDDDEEGDQNTPTPANSDLSNNNDPSTLLAQSLAAYKRGAAIAHDNWRIWDNVVTLASRLRPVPVSDLLLALRNILRIRNTEDALDVDVLRLLVNEALLSRESPPSGSGVSEEEIGDGKGKGVYELPRGTPQRAVCDFVEGGVVPLVTARSELWELVTRERVWRGDYTGAVDAAERAWRAAVGGATSSGGGLLPGGAREVPGQNWLTDREGWRTVVERTDELVSMLENYGDGVPAIGARWKGKARSAVRSVMGKAKENWEGSEEWERLVGLLEGLK